MLSEALSVVDFWESGVKVSWALVETSFRAESDIMIDLVGCVCVVVVTMMSLKLTFRRNYLDLRRMIERICLQRKEL